MAYPSDTYLELKLSGVWTDVTSDVIGDIECSSGIHGWDISDRVADAGKMTFTLRNVNNEYTPGHASCRAGFYVGIKARYRVKIYYSGYVTYTRFCGWVMSDSIEVDSNPWNSVTKVTAYDYMQILADHELRNASLQANLDFGQTCGVLTDLMPIQPSYDTAFGGVEDFQFVFDTMKDKTYGLSEMAKICQTELGFCYVRNDYDDEQLVYEGRNYRIINTSINTTAQGDSYTFDSNFKDSKISHGRYYYNCINTTVYPREYTSTAYDTLLFKLNDVVSIGSGETIIITGGFTDPEQKAQTITSAGLYPLTNDNIKFNSAPDGTGTDLISYMTTLTLTDHVNQFSLEITNSYSSTAYLWFWELYGLGVRIWDSVSQTFEDTAKITADGRRQFNLDLKYQRNNLVAVDIGNQLLDLYSVKRTTLDKVTIVANRSDALIRMFAQMQVGHRMRLMEDSAGIDAEYYLHGLDWKARPGGYIEFTMFLAPAALYAGTYWILGYVGKSEIGTHTYMGY